MDQLLHFSALGENKKRSRCLQWNSSPENAGHRVINRILFVKGAGTVDEASRTNRNFTSEKMPVARGAQVRVKQRDEIARITFQNRHAHNSRNFAANKRNIFCCGNYRQIKQYNG